MTTTQATEPIRPIYGPNDPRWAELAAWITEHGDPDRAPIEALIPTERGSWHEMRVLGRDIRETTSREFEYPEFPQDAVTPTWAERHDDDVDLDDHERPMRLWYRDLEPRAGISASIVQESTLDVDARRVIDGAAELSMRIGDDESVRFASPERAREVAAAILAAADEFEQLTR